MAVDAPDMPRPPLGQNHSGTRSRGNSSAAANKYRPDNYLHPNTPQGTMPMAQQQGGAYFPNSAPITPPGGGSPNLSHGGTPTYPLTPQAYPHPSHLAQQYTPHTSSPMAIPNPNQHQQYMRAAQQGAAPPYPVDDPWGGPGMGPSSAPGPNTGALGTSAPTGSSGGYFPVPGQKYLTPQHGSNRRGSESNMRAGYEYNGGNGGSYSSTRPRRSSAPGHRKSSDYEDDDDDDREYRRKQHRHHHHHHDDTEHRPTIGDTMVSMFGFVKDYLGPVHRE